VVHLEGLGVPGGWTDPDCGRRGDATLLVQMGYEAEEEFARTENLPDPNSSDVEEMQTILRLLRKRIQEDPQFWHRTVSGIVGVSEETTTESIACIRWRSPEGCYSPRST